MAMLSIKMHNF